MTYFSTKAIVADIQKADKSRVNAYFLWKLSNTVKQRFVNLTQFVSKIVPFAQHIDNTGVLWENFEIEEICQILNVSIDRCYTL